MTALEAPRVVLVGAGQMGGALARGWLEAVRRGGGLELTVIEPNFDVQLAQALDSVGAVLNPPEHRKADIVVLALKPQAFLGALDSVRGFLGPDVLVLSVMAGLSIAQIARATGAERVVRAMPNTPGQIGRGVTAFVAAPACSASDLALVEQLLSPLGAVAPIPAERLMDLVTAVSGSGPAYVFLLAEVLAAVGEAEGLDRQTAQALARQTVAGAGALMLESDQDAAALRKQVTSPGGTTQAALDVLQAPDGLAPLLRRAVAAAARRSRELGKESES